MKSILDPSFQYTPSAQTDLRKTFARIRREQKRQQEVPAARAEARAPASVSRIHLGRTAADMY